MWRCNISKFPYFVPCTLFLIILKINTLFSCQNFFNQFLVNWRNVLKLSMLMPQFGPAMRYKDQFHRPILYHIDVVGSWNGFLRVAVSLLTLRLLLANSCPGVSLFGCSSLVFFVSGVLPSSSDLFSASGIFILCSGLWVNRRKWGEDRESAKNYLVSRFPVDCTQKRNLLLLGFRLNLFAFRTALNRLTDNALGVYY